MILTLFAGVVTTTADNVVSVSKALIPQGKTGTFSIELMNTDVFASSIEVHLTLPEGITYQSVSLSNRFTDNPTVSGIQNGQSVTITTLSSTNAAITGNSGPLFFISVTADKTLGVGDVLTGSITKMELAKKVGNNHVKWNPESFDFDIEITDYVILDENSVVDPIAQSEVNAKVYRTIKANEWSTLCLPFDMTEEQVKEIFGDDVQLAYFAGYDVVKDGTNVTGITINFEDDDLSEGFSGNYPYVIKTSKDITEFTLTATITPDEVLESYSSGKGTNKKAGKFIGTYQANTTVPDNSLFLSGNKFWYSKGLTKMKAFRAYLTINDVLTDKGEAEARIMISFNDETTGVKTIDNDQLPIHNTIYDLQGRRIENPTKGLYIRNGRKEVVK